MLGVRSALGRPMARQCAVCRVAAALATALALALAACGGNEEEEIVPEQPVEQLYNDAMDQLFDDRYDKAAKLFDEVEHQHPYSVWATKGQLMAAFAYYRSSDYAEAVVTLDHFIELHPAHENIDYAYYLRALCFYERITDVSRDQQMTERARDSLEELVNRFPDSRYAADAKPKLILVRDQLAGKEMEIGRYYQVRGNYLAAINRFSMVVTKYQTTSHVPEALHRLTELYLALGVMDAAQEYAAVLGYNFPGSDWYEDSYDLLIHQHHVAAAAAPAAQPANYAPPQNGAQPAVPESGAPQQAPAAAYPAYPDYQSYPGYQGNPGYQSYPGYEAYPAPAPEGPPAPGMPAAPVPAPGAEATPPAPAPAPAAPPPAPAPAAAAPNTDVWGGALPQGNPPTAAPYPGY